MSDCLLLIQAWEAQMRAQVRQRAPGGGQADKARLSSLSEKLFYILFYFKCAPTFDVAGFLFDCDRSQAHRWMHRLQPLLEAALGQKMVLPERKLESIEPFLQRDPEVKEGVLATRPGSQRRGDGWDRTTDCSSKRLRTATGT